MKTMVLAFVSSLAFVACASSNAFDETAQVPLSTAEGNAAPGLAVTVTKQAIFVDGHAVVTVTNGTVDPKLKRDGENGYHITPLVEALEKRAGPGDDTAKRARKPVGTHVTLSIDRTLSFRLFTEVLYSCGQAGHDKYDLIVRRAIGGSLAAINFVVPDSSAGGTEPVVWVTSNAFKVHIDGEWSEVPKLKSGRYDYEGLRIRLTKLKASAGDDEHDRAILTADASVLYEVIVATMDAMRVTQEETPLFPVIEFAAGVM
jgi:biopolymer transport protein ExbD